MWVLIPDTSTDTSLWYHFSPGVLWGILFYAGLSYSTCLAGLGYNYISSFYPAKASKAAIHAVCVSLSRQLGDMPLWQGLWADSVTEALTDQPALNKSHLIIWTLFIVNWDINWKPELDQFKEMEWDFGLRRTLKQDLLHWQRTRAFVNILNVSRKRGADLRSVSAHIGERDSNSYSENNKELLNSSSLQWLIAIP